MDTAVSNGLLAVIGFSVIANFVKVSLTRTVQVDPNWLPLIVSVAPVPLLPAVSSVEMTELK
jgi:hypothetical protein